MAKLMIPGPCGHEVIEFDPKVGPDHPSVREAMERLDDLVKNHKMLAITKNPGDREYTKITDLLDAKEETTFLPQRQGG